MVAGFTYRAAKSLGALLPSMVSFTSGVIHSTSRPGKQWAPVAGDGLMCCHTSFKRKHAPKAATHTGVPPDHYEPPMDPARTSCTVHGSRLASRPAIPKP